MTLDVTYLEKFIDRIRADEWLERLNKEIRWTRPQIFVFGRQCKQPRETCYVADAGLPAYKYSGYEPVVHTWEECGALESARAALQEAFLGVTFNSVLLNRYSNGSDYVSWHSDNEPLYGPTPTIASISLGAEREFLMRRKKPSLKGRKRSLDECQSVFKKPEQHSFMLKHGSLLLMKGHTQRDWEHSLPVRKRVNSLRINMTFRTVTL